MMKIIDRFLDAIDGKANPGSIFSSAIITVIILWFILGFFALDSIGVSTS